MKIWIPCELHTHTQASDGKFTLLELAENAKRVGLEAFAITDHNTLHLDSEIKEVAHRVGIEIISGLEWTTFYGHLVTLGLKDYADWRKIGHTEIHKGLNDIHKKQGIAGIAHPFRPGGALGTGCYWEFKVEDWSDIDYIEVWSGLTPYLNNNSKRAYEFWINTLNDGNKITAVSGRDWHEEYNGYELPAVTYLGIDPNDHRSFQEKALEAIKNGLVCVTTGPLINMSAKCNDTGSEKLIGDDIVVDNASYIKIKLELDWETRKALWSLDPENLEVILKSNKGIIYNSCIAINEKNLEVNIPSNGLMWLTAELISNGNKVAFTNPIYFKNVK